MEILKINKEFFDLNVIKQAISDYSEIANILFDEGCKYYTLSIISEGSIIVSKEFDNYLIDLAGIKK